MKEELFPLFNEVYKGLTRISKADLQSQSLLRDTKGHKYIWIIIWNGDPEAVRGSLYENTRMSKPESMKEADALLKKLETFGTRFPEKIFSEVTHTTATVNKQLLRFHHR